MKKIFILPILIAPIVAYATDPIGPAHVNSEAVVATANAPYATATEQTGDSTTVVSASYVKGAYNDAIAAINKVNSDKQNILYTFGGRNVSGIVADAYIFDDSLRNGDVYGDLADDLITADAVAAGLDYVVEIIDDKRINAVTTWGNDTPTKLTLTNQ